MLTIYSLGDPWYLGKVMDAIAMISGSKSGFIGASEVAALIGVLIVGFQSILRLQINIHHLLVCYIVYMGCFSTTTDVAIESVYSDKTVIQKDNVPLGPAVLGSVISQIGYGLTQKMEIAFSDIDEAKMTNGKSNGYLNPLHVLNNLANWSENGELLDYMLNTPQGRNLSRNYILYVADCTTKSVFLGRQWGGKTWNDVFSQSFGNDIKFKSDLYGTEFINSSDQAEVLSCTEGYDKLMEQINLALTQVLGDSKKAQNILNKIGQCQGGSCQETLGLTSPIETIEQALEALNLGSVDAQKFMLNGMLENLKKTGLAAGFKHYRDVNTANMLYQSIQQRNLQWASEGNIFLNAMRPMMAFIEGFFYAISPFAAIIMLLGLFGLNIFFKYIMLLLWIQLWTPIMAIANLFIITSAKQALNPLTLTDTTALEGGAISTYYYESIVQVCQDKIAVGSMMLAATPVLSLMIISGSVYAFTSLTNRIAGADHFNEKVLTPDIVNPGSVMNKQDMFTADNFAIRSSGANFTGLNIGETAQSILSSGRQLSNDIQESMQNRYEDAMSQIGNSIRQNGLEATFSKGRAFTHSDAFQNLQNRVENAISQGGFGSEVSKSDAFSITAGIAGKLLNLVNAGLGTNFNVSESAAVNEALSNSKAVGDIMNSTNATQLNDAMQASLADKTGKQWNDVVSGETKTAFQESYTASKSITNTSSDVKSAAETLSTMDNVTSIDVAARLRNTGDINKTYDKYLQRFREYDAVHHAGLTTLLTAAHDTVKKQSGYAPNIAAGDSEAVAQYEALLKVNSNTDNAEINAMINSMKGDAIKLGAKAYGWNGKDAENMRNSAQQSPDVSGLRTEDEIKRNGNIIKTGANARISEAANHQSDPLTTNRENADFVNGTYYTAKQLHDDELSAKDREDRENNTNTTGSTTRPVTPEELNNLHFKPRPQSEQYKEWYDEQQQYVGGIKSYFKTHLHPSTELENQVLDAVVDLRMKANILATRSTNEEVREQYRVAEENTRKILAEYKKEYDADPRHIKDNKTYDVENTIKNYGKESRMITNASFDQMIIGGRISPI